MKVKKLNEKTYKLNIDKESFKDLEEIFGYNLTIYNEDLVAYLEECMEFIMLPEGNNEIFYMIIRFKVNKKKKKVYAVFVQKDIRSEVKHFLICFNSIDECIHFSKYFTFKEDSKLLKLNKKYYFYIESKLKKELDYYASEYFGEVIVDKIKIGRVLEHGNLIITKEATEKLKIL